MSEAIWEAARCEHRRMRLDREQLEGECLDCGELVRGDDFAQAVLLRGDYFEEKVRVLEADRMRRLTQIADMASTLLGDTHLED